MAVFIRIVDARKGRGGIPDESVIGVYAGDRKIERAPGEAAEALQERARALLPEVPVFWLAYRERGKGMR